MAGGLRNVFDLKLADLQTYKQVKGWSIQRLPLLNADGLSTENTRGRPQMQGDGRTASRIPPTGNIPPVQAKRLHYRRRLYNTYFSYIRTGDKRSLMITVAVSECGSGAE